LRAGWPRFARLCQPASVNGQPGIVVNTPRGPAGAIGFTVSDGLITTIDVTLDPDKLGGSAHTPGDPPHDHGAQGESGLLDFFRTREGAGADRIISEALSWPGVDSATGEFGSVVFRVGRRELGHLHGDAVADLPLAPELQDHLVEDSVALGQQRPHDPGWVTVPLGTEDGVQRALALLRANYERA
jgi:Family of unknown function (DUF5519)